MSCFSGPEIITDGLQICIDTSNVKSITTDLNLITNKPYNRRPSFLEPSGNLNNFTLFAIFEKTGTTTNYSATPLAKYGGTSAASWRLYHFGNFNNNGDDGSMRYYTTTANGTWTSFSGYHKAVVGEIFEFSLQYDFVTGGQVWLNGNKNRAKGLAGGLKTNTTNLDIVTVSSVIKTLYVGIYDRTLTDNEMIKNHQSLKGKFGI